MTIKITSRKGKNWYGDWEVFTVSNIPSSIYGRVRSPWKIVFWDNRLVRVIINGDLFFIRFANSKLEDSILDRRNTPKQLINSIVQAIEYENWELYRLNDLEMLKYMPSALLKSLKIVGAPMWAINGLPGSNKRR
jgi:hypothetical protein